MNKTCAICNASLEDFTAARKYCRTCAKARDLTRARERQRRITAEKKAARQETAPRKCAICKTQITAPERVQKYCKACAPGVKRAQMLERYYEQKEESAAKEKFKSPSRKNPKSLSRLAAEAAAVGLTYGQYTSSINAGTLAQVLVNRGVIDYEKRIATVKIR